MMTCSEKAMRAALEAVSASPSLEGVGVKALEEPGFTYYECPECGFDCIHPADYEPRSTACPLCAGDSGHDVGMNSRTSLSTDKPEGKDARPALTLAASPQAEAPTAELYCGDAAVVCAKCNDTGMVAIRSRDGSYAFPGPVPDDAKGYADADCWYCDCGRPPEELSQLEALGLAIGGRGVVE